MVEAGLHGDAPVLAFDRVTAEGASPDQWLYVLHGIYGAGRNWASVIRRVVRARPDWGALLVDLRQHGESQGFPEPHTVQAAAADLERLAAHTGHAPAAVLGHSFGGKVAMVFASGAGEAAASLKQVWVVDSTPDTSDEPSGSAWTMLTMLRSLPHRFASRDELIDALVSLGMDRGVAQWMATNLESRDDGYHWRFDFDAMEELLHSFYRTETWTLVESPREGLDVHLIRAERSSVLSGPALERVERAAEGPRTFLHPVAGGHWVNAENPQAVEELLVTLLPEETV